MVSVADYGPCFFLQIFMYKTSLKLLRTINFCNCMIDRRGLYVCVYVENRTRGQIVLFDVARARHYMSSKLYL